MKRPFRPSVLTGASWNTVAQAVTAAAAVIITPFLIRHLGLSRYGLLSLVLAVNVFLGSFDGGLGSTAGRYFAVYAGTDNRESTTSLLTTLFCLICGFGATLSAGIFWAAPHAIHLFHVPPGLRSQGVFLFRTVGILITFAFLHSLFVALVQARQHYAISSIATTASYLTWILGLVVVILAGYGLRAIAVLLIAQQILASLLIIPVACRYLQRRHIRLVPVAQLRDVLSYSWKIQVSALSTIVNNQLDAFIIGLLLPVRFVGIFSAGSNIALQVRGILGNALQPAANEISRVFGKSGAGAAFSLFVRYQRIWVSVVTGWFCCLIGVSYFAVVAWLGPSFKLGGLTATLLLAGYMVNMYTGMLTVWLNAIGRPGVETRYGTVAMVLNVVLTGSLAVFGLIGIVAATAVATAVGSFYLLRIVRRRVSADVPAFIKVIPIPAGTATLAVTVGLSLLLAPHAPRGFLGLLFSGIPTLPGALVFIVFLLGPSRLIAVIRSPRRLRYELRAVVAAGGADLEVNL